MLLSVNRRLAVCVRFETCTQAHSHTHTDLKQPPGLGHCLNLSLQLSTAAFTAKKTPFAGSPCIQSFVHLNFIMLQCAPCIDAFASHGCTSTTPRSPCRYASACHSCILSTPHTPGSLWPHLLSRVESRLPWLQVDYPAAGPLGNTQAPGGSDASACHGCCQAAYQRHPPPPAVLALMLLPAMAADRRPPQSLHTHGALPVPGYQLHCTAG
jgi:hypothetical protein